MHSLRSKFLKKMGRAEDSEEFIAARDRYKALRESYSLLASSSKSFCDQQIKAQGSKKILASSFLKLYELEKDAGTCPWTQYEQLLNSLVFLESNFVESAQDHLVKPTKEFLERTQAAHNLKTQYSKAQIERDAAVKKLESLQKKGQPVDQAEENVRAADERMNQTSREFATEVVKLESEHCGESSVFEFLGDLLDYHRECLNTIQKSMEFLKRHSADRIKSVRLTSSVPEAVGIGFAEEVPLAAVAPSAPEPDNEQAYLSDIARSLSEAAPNMYPTVDEDKHENTACAEVPFGAVALHPYEAQESNELSFQAGDNVVVVQTVFEGQVAEWWEGECDGRTGFFPANFVKRLE